MPTGSLGNEKGKLVACMDINNDILADYTAPGWAGNL